jgi:hypothetical protein
MIRSSVSLAQTTDGDWVVLEHTSTVVLASFGTKRLARAFLREARAAERAAAKYLRQIETDGERTACDVRCTSAVGPICECSCMGANHSADHH